MLFIYALYELLRILAALLLLSSASLALISCPVRDEKQDSWSPFAVPEGKFLPSIQQVAANRSVREELDLAGWVHSIGFPFFPWLVIRGFGVRKGRSHMGQAY